MVIFGPGSKAKRKKDISRRKRISQKMRRKKEKIPGIEKYLVREVFGTPALHLLLPNHLLLLLLLILQILKRRQDQMQLELFQSGRGGTLTSFLRKETQNFP